MKTTQRLPLLGADVTLLTDVIPGADALFESIRSSAPWQQEEITLFGKKRPMPRLTCWMGDAAYTYSGLLNVPAPWSRPVRQVRKVVERLTETRFNGVLLNLYRDGSDSMGWHADDERALGKNPVIASVSLGATRRFRFKPKKHAEGEACGIDLSNGSVLIMRNDTQANWLHAVPRTARAVGPRINLTFRWIEEGVRP